MKSADPRVTLEEGAAAAALAPSAHGAGGPRELPIADPSHYVIRGEHARGGQGRVLEAWDRRLERVVAIKELLRGSPAAAERFDREARLTAKLQHPGVVPILEAARWPSGDPFYVMKMVSGRPLGDVMRDARSLDERLALLPTVLAVADTLAYAHSRRIIHRDVKPANVLVAAYGETVLIDWGLGRDLAVDEPEPSAAGTPGYMPPEQAAGVPLDERADVYALGSVMYRLLVGLSPDDAEPVDGAALERREAGIPADLAAIVRTAIASDPRERYQSAQQLSDDLRRFLQGQLVSAHRYSRLQLLRRWMARHRAPLSVAAVLSLALVVTATASVRRIVREKEHAEAERARADERTNSLILSQAESWLERDPTGAVAWIKRYPKNGAEPQRALALALDATSRGIARHVLAGHDRDVVGGGFLPDGRRFLSAGIDGTVRLWSVDDGRLLSTKKRMGAIGLVRISPDGSKVVTTHSGDGVIELATPDGEAAVLGRARGDTSAAAFSADGRQLATGGYDEVIRWWDLDTRRAVTISGHKGTIFGLAFLPDGKQLVSVGEDGTVRLWRHDGTGRVLHTATTKVTQLVVHPDGRRFAWAGLDGEVWLWDLTSNSGRVVLTHDGTVTDLGFSADGSWLASCGRDGAARVVELATGKSKTLQGPGGELVEIALSRDGGIVVAGAANGAIHQWDRLRGERTTLLGHAAAISSLVVSPDGALLASMARDGTTRLWPLVQHGVVLRGHSDAVFDVAFASDGRRLASSGRDQTVRVWNEQGDAIVLRGHRDVVQRVRFVPDGSTLISASLDNTVRAWPLDHPVGAPAVDAALRLFDFAFVRDGAGFVGRGPDATLSVVDLASHARRQLRGPTQQIFGLALTPDQRTVAGASKDGSVWAWNVDSDQGRLLGRHDEGAFAVAISPDGRVVASGGGDRVVRLWPLDGGAPRTLSGSRGLISDVTFSADGRWLAATEAKNTIRVWDLATSRSLELVGHRDVIRRIRFCGTRLVSGSFDGTVRIWNVETGASRIAHRHAGYVRALDVAKDDRMIASASTDTTVWYGDIDDGPLLPPDADGLKRTLSTLTTAEIGPSNVVMSSPKELR